MQKIIPNLWFDTNAEEAVGFYTSIFNEGEVLRKTVYTEVGYDIHGMEAGTIMTIEFEIEGYRMVAINGGDSFKPNPSISFTVHRPNIESVRDLWMKLSAGGEVLMPLDEYPFSKQYGWIQDKYGYSWQISVADKILEQNVVPSFLFVGEQCGRAEEAIDFYTLVFENSSIGMIARYEANQFPDKEGTIMYADFFLANQKFIAMDSAQDHKFDFNEAISLMVLCKDQEEIDYYWQKLSAVPESEICGWLKDKFGVSWQIVPEGMEDILNNEDMEKANKAMSAMLKMGKIEIIKLEQAAEE